MAISKEQPMRPALIDVVDGHSELETALEETNTVIGQLRDEIGAEIARATAAEQDNAQAIATEQARAEAAEQAIASDVAAIPAFEYGAQNNVEILADDSETVTVTFNDEKQSAPYLVVSLQCPETVEGATSDCYVIITEVTTTGFTVRVVNKDALNTIEVTVYWLAIGE